MHLNGLFSNETFIDFENVKTEDGQALGTVLSTRLRSQPVIGKGRDTQLELCTYQLEYAEGNQTQTHRVLDSPPYLVLNKLEHLGYKVVAANTQRPGITSVAYNVWTLHKPPLA